MWNYLNTPHLLTRADVEVRAGDPWNQDGEAWRRLEVVFPEELRHPFARADVLLRRARGCAATTTSRRWSGDGRTAPTTAPTTSRPEGWGFRPGAGCARSSPANRSLPFPTMVWIELDDVRVT